MRLCIIFVLALAAISCSRSQDMARFHEDGRAKPSVTIVSMIDTTAFEGPWSLSDELTSLIVGRLSQSGTLYVVSKDDIAIAENPFGSDLNWVKREFNNDEFVVFLELVEHENVPVVKNPNELASTNLNVAVRMRIVDLRAQTPRIVLQELVRDTQFIPKNVFPTDYSVATWGTDEYNKSPMAVAHAKLAGEISSRVYDYVHLAKSR